MSKQDQQWSRAGSVSPSQLSTASSGSPLVRGDSPTGSQKSNRPRNTNAGGSNPRRLDPVAIAAAQLKSQEARRQVETGGMRPTSGAHATERSRLEKERQAAASSGQLEGGPSGLDKSGVGLGFGRFSLSRDYWTVSNRLRYLNLACLLATIGCLLAVFWLTGGGGGSGGLASSRGHRAGASSLPIPLASRRDESEPAAAKTADEFELANAQLRPKKSPPAHSEREIEDSFDDPPPPQVASEPEINVSPSPSSSASSSRSQRLDKLLSKIFGGVASSSAHSEPELGGLFNSAAPIGQTIIIRGSIGPAGLVDDEGGVSGSNRSSLGAGSLLERLLTAASSQQQQAYLSPMGPPRAWWSMTSPMSMGHHHHHQHQHNHLSGPSMMMMAASPDDPMQAAMSRAWPAPGPPGMFEPAPPLFAAPFPASPPAHHLLGGPHALPAPAGLLGMIVRAASQLDEMASAASALESAANSTKTAANATSSSGAEQVSRHSDTSRQIIPFKSLYQLGGGRHNNHHAHQLPTMLLMSSASLPSPFEPSPFQPTPSFTMMGGSPVRLPADPMLRAIVSSLAAGGPQLQEANNSPDNKTNEQTNDDQEEPIEWQPASSEPAPIREDPLAGSGPNDTRLTGSWSESSSSSEVMQQQGEPPGGGLVTGTIRQTLRGPGLNMERVIELPEQVLANARSQSIRREFEEPDEPVFVGGSPGADSRMDLAEPLPGPLGNLFGRLLADLSRRQARNRSLLAESSSPSQLEGSIGESSSSPMLAESLVEADSSGGPPPGETDPSGGELVGRPNVSVFGPPLLRSPKIRLLSARIRIRPLGLAPVTGDQSEVGPASLEDTLNSMEDRLSQVMANLGRPDSAPKTPNPTTPVETTTTTTTTRVPVRVPVSHIAMGRANQPQVSVTQPPPPATIDRSSDNEQPMKPENPYTSPSSPLFGFPSMAHQQDDSSPQVVAKERAAGSGNRQHRAFTFHSNFELAAPAKRQQQQQQQQRLDAAAAAAAEQTQEFPPPIKARFLDTGLGAASQSGGLSEEQADVMGRRLDDGPFSARSIAD